MIQPGSPAFSMPPAVDDQVRKQRDIARQQMEQSAGRSLEASEIGRGGLKVSGGGIIITNGGTFICDGDATFNGSLVVPAGSLSTAGSITAGASLNANSLAIIADATVGGTLAAGALSSSGNTDVGGDINLTGDLYTPHGRATPVVTSYVAGYIDSVGRLGATPSSKRFKNLLNNFVADIPSFMDITFRRFVYKEDVNQTPRLGAWAEDVNVSFPELVVHEDGEPYALHKEDFFALYGSILQQQQVVIEALAARIEALEG